MTFHPINNAHAISEMVVHFAFVPPFNSETLNTLLSLKDELKADFPKSNELKHVSFTIDANTQKQVVEQTIGGITLERYNTNGTPSWVINITNENISIHCLSYTRWENVWAETCKYLEKIFKKIDGTANFLQGFGLQYTDKFVFEEDKPYSHGALFKTNSNYLNANSFDCGDRWHCNSGWFEKLDTSRCLHQLNIDNSQVLLEGKMQLVSTILHNAVVLREPSEQFNLSLDKDAHLNTAFQQLHIKNKAMLSNLLNEEMANRIQLKS